ncbi:hypothetical protein ABPG75_009025 [Micractinium tetrahymenae]
MPACCSAGHSGGSRAGAGMHAHRHSSGCSHMLTMFKVVSTSDGARRGELATASGTLPTPALLVYTHRGGVLNLTPDLLEKLPDAQAVQIDGLQFVNQPKPEVLQQAPGGGRRFLALDAPPRVLVATARDPAIYEYLGAMRQATKEWASVSIHTGAATVTAEQYVEAVAALQPDLWVALSDDIPNDSRSDRCPKSVDRTVAWLPACMAAAAGAPALAGAGALAAVQGGQYVNERIRCAEAAAKQPGLAGVVVAALGTGESPELRATIIAEVTARFPEGALRMVSSVGTPEDVLEAVAQGIDLFDSAHLVNLVAGGYALSFPVTPEEEAAQQAAAAGPPPAAGAAGETAAAAGAAADGGAAQEQCAADRGEDDSKINLWSLAYRTDARPLLPGCSCFACANHTRAYLHHLLQTHEMTAQVLLELHNTHHYLRFFAAIRDGIAAGRFGEYRAWFLGRRQRWLVEGR